MRSHAKPHFKNHKSVFRKFWRVLIFWRLFSWKTNVPSSGIGRKLSILLIVFCSQEKLILSTFSNTIRKTFKKFGQISRFVVTRKGWFWYERVAFQKLYNNVPESFVVICCFHSKSNTIQNLPKRANWLFRS